MKCNKKTTTSQTTKSTEPSETFFGTICISPSLVNALKKMRNWMGSFGEMQETISRSEVKSMAANSFQPIFQNDYAPTSIKNELNSIPSPTFLEGTKTEKPDCISLSWEQPNGRSLYLVQVNVENPEFASCWITYSICMHPKVVVTDVNPNIPCWFRICTMTNEGRSKWAVLSLAECTEPSTLESKINAKG